MQLDSLQGGLDFLKEQVRIACTSAQNSASSTQFDFLKCQLDKHQNTIQTWHDFWAREQEKNSQRSQQIASLDGKMSALANHFETEVAKLVSLIPGPPPPLTERGASV